ncbi:MAG: stage V sporulation protein AB [Eubacterium sp.]|nr:stage V sporulation protein AB [Eubacterium sp.]
MMPVILLSWIALGAGFAVSGGFFAFISLIGIVPRLASVSKTVSHIRLYETFLASGIILVNLISIYHPDLSGIPYPGALFILDLQGLFSGIFTGCLAGALAEVVNVVPILSRRLKIRKGFPRYVIAFALGKCAGSLLQLYYFSQL